MEEYRKNLKKQLGSASDSFDSHEDCEKSHQSNGEIMSELTHSDLLGSASSGQSSKQDMSL
jgi:hypothetical protein